MTGSLRSLRHIDAYNLYNALKDGDRVTFTIGAGNEEYTGQFHGQRIGADNYLEVANGETTQRWGWGWEPETIFHFLQDVEEGNFLTPSFPYRSALEPDANAEW